MLQETKYYTPTIEEFHVGFEYETQNIENAQWGKCICTPGFGAYYNEVDDLNEERIRVKYLDKEDIESLGFKQITDDCYNLPIKEFRGRLNQEVRILVRDTILIYIAKELNELNTHVLFTGYIKNKSELKKLLKQLNIN